MTSFKDKLIPREKRRLLAIDGGGVRAGISIGLLTGIETVLRKRNGKPDLVLADYFDYIAGTSVGSILAAALSLGMSMAEVRQFTLNSVRSFFEPSGLLNRVKFKYAAEGVKGRLQELFGDMELGSPRLRTLLLIMMRNASTDSAWPVTNNPFAKFNSSDQPDCNLMLPLWQLLRSSTAAPTFFPSEKLILGGREFAFVDGGLTIANNPAFQLFLQATLPSYCLQWPTGPEAILLISVGTGHVPARNTADSNLVTNAIGAIQSLLSATDVEQDLLCRLFGRCLCGDQVDQEIGDLIGLEPAWPQQFSYCRYNMELNDLRLQELDWDYPAETYHPIDKYHNYESLLEIGDRLAADQVRSEHFANFDMEGPSEARLGDEIC